MNFFQSVGVILCLVLAYDGYKSQPSSPTIPDVSEIKVTLEKESYAPLTDAKLLEISDPLISLLQGNKDDAITLARVYQQWSDLIGRNTTIKTTTEFQEIYLKASRILFEKHPIAGKYKGQIDDVFDKIIVECFSRKGLTENSGVKIMDWNQDCRDATIQAFNALSSQCFSAYVQGSIASN